MTSNAAGEAGDVAANAKQLQLEGTRLQLQGKSAEAVKKYRESVALQPNPRLDTLIQQLEGKKKNKNETAVASSAPAATAGSAPEQQPASAPTVPGTEVVSAPTTSVTAEPAVTAEPPQRTPGTPEEELIYTFTDTFLSLFPVPGADKDFSLQTNRDYTIASVDGEYEVRLQPFSVQIDKTDLIELGSVVLRFTPKGKDLLAFRMQLADKIQLMSAGKRKADITFGSQQLSGVWNRSRFSFDALTVKLTDLIVQSADTDGRFSLAALTLETGRDGDQTNSWVERLNGELSQLVFTGKTGKCTINSITGQTEMNGTNPQRFYELWAKLQQGLRSSKELSVAEQQALFMSDLDEYLQLLSAYIGSASLKGFEVVTPDGTFSLESIVFDKALRKQSETGQFTYDSQAQFNTISFAEKGSEPNSQPKAVTLGQLTIKGNGSLKPLPAKLFADIHAAIEGFQQVKQEEKDAYAAHHGVQFTKKILEIIKGYKAEVSVKDLKVVNVQPEPVNLSAATLAAGFDVGDGQGGKIDALVDFSGFTGLATAEKNIPQAGRIALELTHIPSLMALIPDTKTLAEGNTEAIQGHLTMSATAAFLQSRLALSLTDSFVAFPASKIILGLQAAVDQKAKYLSTGTLKLSIENPEEFNRILKTYSADPEMEQIMAVFASLVSRKQEGEKTVDHMDATIDAAGKVIINTKDVTSMFFPTEG